MPVNAATSGPADRTTPKGLVDRLPERPKAIIVVSGHWETDGFAFTGAARPSLIYDYYGFPADTYAIRYDVPGVPELAARAAKLLQDAGVKASVDPTRGLDHGVFVPLKVAFPDADIPMIEISVERTLDPALHSAAGRALATLREEGVLILGSGMSFHNMRAYVRMVDVVIGAAVGLICARFLLKSK